MIPDDVLRAVDYAVLGVSGLGFLLCLAGALLAVPWRSALRQPATRELSVFWRARIALQVSGALWLLAQWLRLFALWGPGSRIMPARVTRWSRNGLLCRAYLCVSLGLLQPFFLLVALLLCRSALSRARPERGMWPNAWVAAVAFAGAMPLLAAVAVVAWLGALLPGAHLEVTRSQLPSLFFAAFLAEDAPRCGPPAGRTCALCVFPAATCIATGVFALAYAIALGATTRAMARAAINKRLRRRVLTFQAATLSLLAAQQALQAATLAGAPGGWLFQLLWAACFAAQAALVATVCTSLVVRPVLDALDASSNLGASPALLGSWSGQPPTAGAPAAAKGA
ncbi:hypothetical protein WJX81_002865 [Elliptochloris bilobata]|uniref:Uncharacterized protein n=1 Tax=Elliptochloris bilobata TaxID=381761 RepID=A0AAW1RFZ9_9CHLO